MRARLSTFSQNFEKSIKYSNFSNNWERFNKKPKSYLNTTRFVDIFQKKLGMDVKKIDKHNYYGNPFKKSSNTSQGVINHQQLKTAFIFLSDLFIFLIIQKNNTHNDNRFLMIWSKTKGYQVGDLSLFSETMKNIIVSKYKIGYSLNQMLKEI
ncbi:hypothetical protein RFI_36453 [Reticulomyxa filosa]|uniref:Uncharacterized protein n=1 Tax=Reticulomyxa filosa TaxID=46433 RepID=X6LIL9_RETFI|nr:hypothetical protein RFI_36453 [Reticulomyxa filosa]|eukprot:ETO00987.1 hypothetical protein RFI_36453 [Reticulomyxa filosa]